MCFMNQPCTAMLILAVLACLMGESLSGSHCSDIRCETLAPKDCKHGLVKGDSGCNVCAREAGESCSHTGATNGGKCGKYLTCEKGVCRPGAVCILLPCWARHLNCKGGKVKGRCGCDECARVEGETCGWKDHWHIGECDEYLQCYKGVCRHSKKSKKIFIDVSFYKAWPTYDQAEKICKSVGANLPVPASEEESQYLKRLTDKYYWLGISDRWAEGVWRVAHGGNPGPIINYTNWYGTEPNGGTKGQCAFAHDVYWYDVICHTKQSAVICEKYID